ncbi:MAG: hypothetical protein ACYSUC_06300 [Planctomycetota bacterium]|jgi:hypothetical protein
MAIEAPLSKHKKTNLKIYILVCVAAAVIFAYDGYLSRYKWSMRHSFYKKHFIDNNGKPTPTMNFNRRSPFFFVGVAALFGVYLLSVRNSKIIAGEEELVVSDKRRISYSSMERIDKTYFKSKGFFVITYRNEHGQEINCKLSDRRYDNLEAVLEEIVAKIT